MKKLNKQLSATNKLTRAISIALVFVGFTVFSQENSRFFRLNAVGHTTCHNLIEDSNGNCYVSGEFSANGVDWQGVLWRLNSSLEVQDSITSFAGYGISIFSLNIDLNDNIFLVGRALGSDNLKGLEFFRVNENLDLEHFSSLRSPVYDYYPFKALLNQGDSIIALVRAISRDTNRDGLRAFVLDQSGNKKDSSEVYSICRDYVGFLSITSEPLCVLNNSIYLASGASSCSSDEKDEVLKLNENFEFEPIFSKDREITSSGWVYRQTFYHATPLADGNLALGFVLKEDNLSNNFNYDSFQIVKLDAAGNGPLAQKGIFRRLEERKEITKLISFDDHVTLIGVDSAFSYRLDGNPNYSSNIILAEFSNDLELLRSKKVNIGAAVYPTNAIKTRDGGLIVCGDSRERGALYYQGFVVKFDKDLNVTNIAGVGPSTLSLGVRNNPVVDIAELILPNVRGIVHVSNTSGELMWSCEHEGGPLNLNLSNYANGVYHVVYETKSGAGALKLVKVGP
ncbi:MAG TPA: hypothetical protein VFV37_03250 [Luteibaculaceae bacterium]|nr:hypothetical protein [Luteibaculaceae bacterium]